LSGFFRGARAAFVFLTRVPVGGFPYSPEEWKWSSGWFPAVGFVVGTVSAVAWLALASAGPWVAGMAALVVSMMLTGGFHEDGLSDTADALGGAYDPETVLVILKDSRIGVFGGLALIVSVVFRLTLLVALGSLAPVGLVLSHTLARVGPIWLMVALPYVTDAAAKSRLVTRATAAQGGLATLIGLAGLTGIIGLGFAPPRSALPVLLAAVGVTVVCGWRFHARTGGVTGDFLGAAEQVGEVAILLALVLA